MIREVMRRNDDNDYARQLKSYIAQDRPGKYNRRYSCMLNINVYFAIVPDDVVIDLVQERLSKPDCRLNGWVLDGCPFNLNQLKMLREFKIEPQKVIALEVSDEVVLKDLSEQRLHEASGKLFTPAEIAQAPDEVKELLISRPLVQLRAMVTEHQRFLEEAEAEYSRHLVRINAEEPEENVFLSFCDAIESSL